LGSRVERTVLSFVFFCACNSICRAVLGSSGFSNDDKEKLVGAFVSQVHAVVCLFLVYYILLGADGVVLEGDKIFGATDLSMLVEGLSCGYFLYDVPVVLWSRPVDLKFLLHAIVCGGAYWLSQEPYFQYFTVRFLLYELSTPLLNLRTMLVVYSFGEKWVRLVSGLFGIVFVGCRIVYGLYLSCYFLYFLYGQLGLGLVDEGVLYFGLFAGGSMACLNVVWFLVTLFSPPGVDDLHHDKNI